MDISPNLKLPYLSAAQAQKHVTVNDGLRALDALVQLAVLSRVGAAPPASPNDGDRYIVAAGGSGAWTGYSGTVAAWQDGAWSFWTPQKGWIAWIADEAVTVVFSGTAWSPVAPAATGAPTWGVNATADTTNRLAVGSPASLFNNAGNGHQLKINKANPADTGSVLFQTGFSGRAEMGLTGDDNYHVKVSADGSTWHDALLVNSGTGQVTFPNTAGTSYTLPAATPTSLGGVKAGANLTVAADGTLAAPAPVTSLPYSAITGTPSIPAAQVNSDWTASSGLAQILNKPAIPSAYSLPAATASALGGVKVGANLAVAADGTISAPTGTAARDVLLQSTTIGVAAPTSTGATAAGGSTTSYLVNSASPIDGFITSITTATNTAQTVSVLVCTVSGTTATLVSSTPVAIPAGIATTPCLIPIAAGQFFGLQAPSGLYYIASAENLLSTSSAITGGGTAVTATGSPALQFNGTIQGTIAGGLVGAQRNITTLQGQVAATATAVGATTIYGPTPVTATGAGGVRSYFVNAPLAAGTATQIAFWASGAGSVTIYHITPSGSTVGTVNHSLAYTATAGLNIVPLSWIVAAGDLIGVYGDLHYNTTTGGLTSLYMTAAPTNGATLTPYGGWVPEIQVTVQSGLFLAQSTADPAGLTLLNGADNTGVADATATIASAVAVQPYVYLRKGKFATTGVPAYGCGLYGPGRLTVNGSRFIVPPRRTERSIYLGLRAALAPEIANGAPIGIIGDSIAHWAYASIGANHWINQLTKFANLYSSPNDEPMLTALRPSTGTYDPSFYGVTTSGTVSTGTNGPLGESLILASGASLSVTGAYAQIDAYYTQQSGAGSLVFAYNGTTYKTVSAAGATALDTYSGPSATGQTASGTYTITASGGPVEITGLVRLGALTTTAPIPPRLPVFRWAHGSYAFSDFTSTRVTSMLKQAAALGSYPPRVIIALGANDQYQIAPATIAANLTTLVTALKAGGVTKLHAVLPWRFAAGAFTYAGGASYDGALGAMVDAYTTAGVDIVPIHTADFGGQGLLSGLVHPNDAGEDLYAQMLAEHLAGVR